MIKHKKAQWPWHGLTALVLVGLALSLYFATSMISYEWRWNRVPQYFAYQAEEAQRAAGYGTVQDIVSQGDMARVTLRDEDGAEQVLEVAQNSLQMSKGDDVAEGDVVGGHAPAQQRTTRADEAVVADAHGAHEA